MGPAKWPISGLLSAEYPMISVDLRVPAPPHVRATAGPRRATPPPQGIHATTPRRVRAVSMARSEYRRCPPRRPLRPGVQAAIASEDNHTRHIATANEGLVVGRPVRNAILRLIRGMNLRLHPCSVAPAKRHEKYGPNHPARSESSCNNASNECAVVGRPVRNAALCLVPGMDLRLHLCSVAPAESPEKCGPRRPTRAGPSCNNAGYGSRGTAGHRS